MKGSIAFLESSKKKWVSITLLSVLVPVGLLVALRLASLTREPLTPETVQAEAVSWQIDRPTKNIEIRDVVENLHKNENISTVFVIDIEGYIENDGEYGGDDNLMFHVNISCSLTRGFIEGVDIFLVEASNKTRVSMGFNPQIRFEERLLNLSVEEWAELSYSYEPDGSSKQLEKESPVKSYLKTVGVNQPSSVSLLNFFDWLLHTPNDQSHQMEVTLELTYWDQTTYKKLIMPIIMNVVADNDDSFETARPVNDGDYKAYAHIWDDPEDYYKIWLETGETINAQLSSQYPLDFDLYLYDPFQNLAASSCSRLQGAVEQATHTANQTGWWYIRVVLFYAGHEIYDLSLKGDVTS